MKKTIRSHNPKYASPLATYSSEGVILLHLTGALLIRRRSMSSPGAGPRVPDHGCRRRTSTIDLCHLSADKGRHKPRHLSQLGKVGVIHALSDKIKSYKIKIYLS